MNKIENNMYYQANIKTSRNKDINFLQLSYGNFVSLDDYILLEKENKQLKEKLDCDLKWAFKCDELTKENQKLKELQCTFQGTGCQNKMKKYKEVIDKAINWTKDYIKQWDSEDDVISDMEILLNILKEVE